MNNYRDVITDFIEGHRRGEPSVFNVTGVLFYACSVSETPTLRDLYDILQVLTRHTMMYDFMLLLR